MSELLWITISYLLGSIPFGYLITRLSTGKNILEIGWRKTSGSNVLKNIGIWQGVLTGVFDLLKGYFSVYFAKGLGLSVETQVFSGVAAVVGHNWSIFLKFAGGRGIGTFVGAFWALSPALLRIAIASLMIVGLVWNLSIGTLCFLAFSIFISILMGQFKIVGMFTTLSLIPILIKRLSPIGEIPKSKEKSALIRNRLLFDDDISKYELRIKRLFRGERMF